MHTLAFVVSALSYALDNGVKYNECSHSQGDDGDAVEYSSAQDIDGDHKP